MTSINEERPAPIYIDTDNALGSPSGDVDDAFALAAMLSSSLEVRAIASVFGNTSGDLAYENTCSLLRKKKSCIQTLAGACGPGMDSEAARFLSRNTASLRIIALGPLTNISVALGHNPELIRSIDEIAIVGTNSISHGRFPPVWPFEYNLVKDREATRNVLTSGVPLRVIPLDQAGRLRIPFSQLSGIEGELGVYLRAHSERWFLRAKRLKFQNSVPIWDLVAAMTYICPQLFYFEKSHISVNHRGVTRHKYGDIPVTVLQDYSPADVWEAFLQLVNKSLSTNQR